VTRNNKEPEPSPTPGQQKDDRPDEYPQGAAPPEFPDGDWDDFVAAKLRFLKSRGLDSGKAPNDPPAQQPRWMYRSIRTRAFM